MIKVAPDRLPTMTDQLDRDLWALKADLDRLGVIYTPGELLSAQDRLEAVVESARILFERVIAQALVEKAR